MYYEKLENVPIIIKAQQSVASYSRFTAWCEPAFWKQKNPFFETNIFTHEKNSSSIPRIFSSFFLSPSSSATD